MEAAVRESGSIRRTTWRIVSTRSGVSLLGWVTLGGMLDLSGPCLPHVFQWGQWNVLRIWWEGDCRSEAW